MSGWPFDPAHDTTPTTSTTSTTTASPPPSREPPRVADDFESRQRRASANANLLIGLVLLGVGLAITIGTYSSASSNPHGGTYLVMWGPIVFGFMRLMRGLFSR